MKKLTVFAAVLLALCLAGGPVLAEEADFSGVAGVWYTEEVMMRVSEDGRFVIEWFDGDWTGSLEPDPREDEEGVEYTAFRLILDEPEKAEHWEDMELVPDVRHPGKVTLWFNGHPGEEFYSAPVYVREITEEEDLGTYEPYYLIDDAVGREDDPVVTMIFTLLRPAADVAVMTLYDQEIDEEGNLGFCGDTLEWWERLDSQERIVVKHVFEGDLPDLGIFFILEDDGTERDFAVEISGEDGGLFLTPLPPSNG